MVHIKLMNITVRNGLLSVIVLCSLVFFTMYILRPTTHIVGEKDNFLEKYLESTKEYFENKDKMAALSELSIHASSSEFQSYLLLKQEYSMKTYILALTNSVKIVHLPFTKSHLAAIRDCNRFKKPSLFYNQHSLELRFPFILALMSEITDKYRYSPGSSFFDIQWKANRTSLSSSAAMRSHGNSISTSRYSRNGHGSGHHHHYRLIEQDSIFEEPLFYYLQSFVYYIVYCSYKPRGKENWAKGADYMEEIAEHIVHTHEWQINLGVDFISPASHPKSGPMNVHPASLNYFLRQTFLRTDFDFSGNRPKDVVVPYYVDYTENPSKYLNGSNNGRDEMMLIANNKNTYRNKNTKRHDWSPMERALHAGGERGSGDTNKLLILFVGSKNPVGGLREKFEQAFLHRIEKNMYTDIVFSTTGTSHDNYKRLLFNSDFCLCVRGDTASSGRLFSVIEAGCIPVLISDWLHLPFQSLIDYSQFTLSFPESIVNNVEYLIDYLRYMPVERKDKMHQALRDVRPMLLYETSRNDYYILNPVTLSLVESLINRKKYCDQLTTAATVSPMCYKIAKRLQIALLSTSSER